MLPVKIRRRSLVEAPARSQTRMSAFETVSRMAFARLRSPSLRHLNDSELEANRDAIARFGSGLYPVEVLARGLR